MVILSLNSWTYQTDTQLEGFKHWGEFGVYGGGGYVQDLDTEEATSRLWIKSLQDNGWLERGTRAVFIDFNLYNANINLFCVVRLLSISLHFMMLLSNKNKSMFIHVNRLITKGFSFCKICLSFTEEHQVNFRQSVSVDVKMLCMLLSYYLYCPSTALNIQSIQTLIRDISWVRLY